VSPFFSFPPGSLTEFPGRGDGGRIAYDPQAALKKRAEKKPFSEKSLGAAYWPTRFQQTQPEHGNSPAHAAHKLCQRILEGSSRGESGLGDP